MINSIITCSVEVRIRAIEMGNLYANLPNNILLQSRFCGRGFIAIVILNDLDNMKNSCPLFPSVLTFNVNYHSWISILKISSKSVITYEITFYAKQLSTGNILNMRSCSATLLR